MRRFRATTDLAKSIGSGYVLFLTTNLVALLLTPFVLKYLSRSEYGFYILCVELFTWIGFMNLGTAKVLGPKVARELSDKNEAEIVFLFNTSFLFQFGVSLLTIPLYYLIVSLSGAEKSGLQDWPLFVLILAIAASFQNLTSQFGEMIIATKKVHKDNAISIAILLLRFSLILLLLPYSSVAIIFYIYLLMAVIDLLRKYSKVRSLYPYLSISLGFFSKTHFKKLLSKGVPFTMASLATILISKFDQFFLGTEFDLELVAKYYITIKLVVIFEKLINVFLNNFRPHISSMDFRSSETSLKRLYVDLHLVVLILIIFSYSILCLFNDIFIDIWVGEGFFLGHGFANLFAFYIMINVASLPSRIFLISTLSYLWELSTVYFIQALCRVALLYVLFANHGIDSIPISSLIAVLFLGLGAQLLYSVKFFCMNRDILYLCLTFFIVFLLSSATLIAVRQFWFVTFILIAGFLLLLRRFPLNKNMEVLRLISGKH